MRPAIAASVVSCAVFLAACPDDAPPGGPDAADVVDAGDAPDGDATTPIAPSEVFAFGADPAQTLSAAPFPYDLYRGADGIVALAPLGDDPVVSESVTASLLPRWTELAGQRKGFGVVSSVYFFSRAPVDVTSLAGRVRFVSVAGPDAGREVVPKVFDASAWSAVGVTFEYGDYLTPGSTYVVLLEAGVTLEDGRAVEAQPGFAEALTEGATGPGAEARAAFAPVRQWLGEQSLQPDGFVVGTVFTVEETMPFGEALAAAVDAFALEPPTRRVRWDTEAGDWVEMADVEGAGALDAYFGTPEGAQSLNPGIWSTWTRDISGYAGGTFHAGIGRVVNGTLAVPAFNVMPETLENVPFDMSSGTPALRARALAPFTLYLCASQLADPSDLPVAVFTHGGGASRVDAVAYANVNCLSGVATIAIDMAFHGGRRITAWVAGDQVIAPAGPDAYNQFTGVSAGDAGFVADGIGDGGTAVDAVGGMFALPLNLDPAIIEGNLATWGSDTLAVIRTLKEGDWSGIDPALSFDAGAIFHESLSFGSSFSTLVHAVSPDLRGIVASVGTGAVITRILPMSPSNATESSSILNIILGLKSSASALKTRAYADLGLSLLQWLSHRGDPLAWAPHVLRNRQGGGGPVSILSSSTSWDETLQTPAQLSWIRAVGFRVYSDGADWTLDPATPGASLVPAEIVASGPVTGAVEAGGQTHAAPLYINGASCHAQVVTAFCGNWYEHPYPPIAPLAEATGFPSPVCALQHQIRAFLDSLLGGAATATTVPPAGSCEELYAP